MKRTGIKAGAKSLARRSTFKSRGHGLERKPRSGKRTAYGSTLAPRAQGKKAPVKFSPDVKAHELLCVHCLGLGIERFADHQHHWLAQEHIRVYVRGVPELRYDEVARRRLERKLLNDPRNLSPFCEPRHMAHESGQEPFTREDVKSSAWTFADEIGLAWRLDRDYLGRQA